MKALPPLEVTPEDMQVTVHLCRRLIARAGNSIRWLRVTTRGDRRDAELIGLLLECLDQRNYALPILPVTRHIVLAYAALPPEYQIRYAQRH